MARDPSDKKPTAEECEREYLAERERLEALALEFLGGHREEKDGSVLYRYLEPGSEEEAAARAALIRLLHGYTPLSTALCWRIAALFSPDSSDDRQLKFVKRRRGPQKITRALSIEIALFVAQQVRNDVKSDAAMAAATKRFNVALRTVTRAWAENKSSPMIQTMLHHDHTVN